MWFERPSDCTPHGFETSPRASSRPSPPSTRRRGTPAPIRPAAREDEAEGERFNPFISHAFLHALEASGSVGGRTGWTPAHVLVEDAAGASSPPRRPISRATAWANTCSTTPGPTPMSAPAGATIRNCRSPRRSRPATGRRLLVARRRAPRRARGADRGLAGAAQADQGLLDPRDLPDRRGRRTRLERAGFLVRHGEQFHFSSEGSRLSTIFWPRSPRASAKRSNASGATRWATTSRSNG